MKYFSKKLILGLTGLLFITACQRDDICPESTQTTSLLVIRFYDAQNRETPQAPINLRVREVGRDTSWIERKNLDSIAIPLRTNTDETLYEFTLNAQENDSIDENQSIPTNTDILRFSYAREQEYINRACSYKVNFIDLQVQQDTLEDGPWISDFIIEKTTVEDETSAHISIYY